MPESCIVRRENRDRQTPDIDAKCAMHHRESFHADISTAESGLALPIHVFLVLEFDQPGLNVLEREAGGGAVQFVTQSI